jgi:cyclase
VINIPFCVAGGIRTLDDAASILESGADKISINSPALERPSLIDELAGRFGSQCIVIGIDSLEESDKYYVYQYTGDVTKTTNTGKSPIDWAKEVVERGAGEIVLNCMNQDGVRSGYNIDQIKLLSDNVDVPVVASGGAGKKEHFMNLFQQTNATGALAASVFHKGLIDIPDLKTFLNNNKVEVRL